MRERELKPFIGIGHGQSDLSLPMRERELKHPNRRSRHPPPSSLPMRERELKQGACRVIPANAGRSPCGSVN